MRGIGFAFFVLAFLAGGQGLLQGAGPVVLKPRLIPGGESDIQVSGETVMQIPRGGQTSEQKVNTEQRYTVSVEGHEDEKSKKVQIALKSMAMEMEMPGMVMRYDSTDPATRDAVLGAAFKSLINNPVDMVYDESDAFVKMANTDAFKKGGNTPFGQQIGPDQLKQVVRPGLSEGFPEEAVSPGDSWTFTMSVPIPSLGDMEFEVEYRYRNDRFVEDRNCAIVDLKGTLKGEFFEAPKVAPETQGRADHGFEKGAVSGVVVIDKELRLIKESEFNIEMVMKMPSPLGQEEVRVPLRKEIQTSLLSYRQLR